MFQLIICLYSLFQVGFCCDNETSVEKLNKIGGEILESYWESFSVLPYEVANCYPNELNPNYIDETDYVIHLNEIPTDSIKIINIAFASVDLYKCDPRYLPCNWIAACGIHLFDKADNSDDVRLEQLISNIKELQSKGVIVKLAYGGEEWGNSDITNKAKPVLEYAALTIARTVEKLNLDGVDLVQKEGCGSTFVCGDLTSIQLNLLKQLRQNMPNKIISYTFPVDGNNIDFPYRDIVQWGQEYLNTITVYRANEEVINDLMFEMGVPRSKIVWGFYIGCNYEYYPDINVEQAIAYTEKAKILGLAGVMIWSINRDTDHRQNYDAGICNLAQTGLPDGTYHTAISHVLKYTQNNPYSLK